VVDDENANCNAYATALWIPEKKDGFKEPNKSWANPGSLASFARGSRSFMAVDLGKPVKNPVWAPGNRWWTGTAW
jgi:hypothetical protein